MGKVLKFLKNTAVELLGSAMNLSNENIENLKNDNATSFVSDLSSAMGDKSAEIVERRENRELLMTQEYRKAFKRRGLDYDKLYVNKYKTDLDYYLKSINMSREEYYQVLSEIKTEVNSIMELNRY